jgi:hypothetical protein
LRRQGRFLQTAPVFFGGRFANRPYAPPEKMPEIAIRSRRKKCRKSLFGAAGKNVGNRYSENKIAIRKTELTSMGGERTFASGTFQEISKLITHFKKKKL